VPVPVQDLGEDVQAIAAGLAHTCVIANARVRCWGSNTMGQLGNGTLVNSAVPTAPVVFQ